MSSIIAIDFETRLIGPTEIIPRPICLSYYDGKDSGLIAGQDNMEKALEIILDSDAIIVAHNLKFEALITTEHFPKLREKLQKRYNKGTLICTMIYEKLLDNIRKKSGFKYGLDSLVLNYFDIDISESKKDTLINYPDYDNISIDDIHNMLTFKYGKELHPISDRLESICNKYEVNSWRLHYSKLEGIEAKDYPKAARDYAIQDSIWAYRVYKEKQSTVPIDINLSSEAEYYLNLMGLDGICIDVDRVKHLEAELNEKLQPKYRALEKSGLAIKGKDGKFKKKMKLFREHILSIEGLEVEYTAKGTVATSTESLNRYFEMSHDPVLQDYLDVIKYEKIMSAFVVRLKASETLSDPRIRSEYSAVVSSGRTSSRSSSHFPSVNIQQMPREVPGVTWDIRNCFVPRKGYKIASIDYAGLELSSTAHMLYKLTGKRNMLDILNSGDAPVDMHSMFAYKLKNLKEKTSITYKDFVVNKKNPGYKEYRQLAKPINLGFPGGIGYDTMRTLLIKSGITPKFQVLEESEYENRLSWKVKSLRAEGYSVRVRRTAIDNYQLVYDELVELKQELFGLYPDLHLFLTEHHKEYLTGESKNIKNKFGEWELEPMYRYTAHGFMRDYCTYTAFCNGQTMQSPSAIGAKSAMVEIIKRYQDSDLVRPLAFVHDEIVFEVLDDHTVIEEECKNISEILIDSMQNVLTCARITVEAEVFDYWKKSGGFYEATYWKDADTKELKRQWK